MFGRILGKVVGLPLRVANVPFAILAKATDNDDLDEAQPLREAARFVEKAIEDSIDEEDD